MFTDAARHGRLRRGLLLSGGLSILGRLLQRLCGLFGGLSRVAGIALLSRLTGGLHVLLAESGLLTSSFRSVCRLLQVERLLAEPVLGLRQLLPQLAGGGV